MVAPAKTMKAPTLQYPYRALIVALIAPFKKRNPILIIMAPALRLLRPARWRKKPSERRPFFETCKGLKFGVQGLEFRVCGLGFGVGGLGFRDLGFGV